MTNTGLNRLMSELAAVCGDDLFAEKWLLAPSRSIGHQWLDAITRSGRGVLNVRVKTPMGMALDLAADELARTGAARITGLREELLIGSLFSKLPRTPKGYLTKLDQTPGLAQALAGTINDIRLAGIRASDLEPKAFEVGTKGKELAALLEKFEAALKKENAVDLADVFRIAASRLEKDAGAIPQGAVVLLPSDMRSRLGGLVRKMWDAVPSDKKKILEVDPPFEPSESEPSDARLLAWISSPADAPKPTGDGTAGIFSAVGEVGEVREVLRRCLKDRIPLDDVEILHTETATYVPLIFELAARIDTGDGEGIPITFAEGIPVRYSRPARALIGLVSWIQEELPQKNLVHMIQEGLLNIDMPKDAGLDFTHLGEIFRSVPIGFGADKYIPAIENLQGELAKELKQGIDVSDQDAVRVRARQKEDLIGLGAIKALVTRMLGVARDDGAGQTEIIRGALDFMISTARAKGRFDEYSRTRMVNELKEIADDADVTEDVQFDALSLLLSLASRSHVDAKSPRPGCIHVSSIWNGGHSGRGHTFIVGLDDTRFPGSFGQDSLLLDVERRSVSSELVTGATRMEQKLESFNHLLARLKGKVFLSFCSRSLTDDRDMFAGSAIIAAFRILSGNREGDHESLLQWLPDPVSFSPCDADSAVDSTEWWLSRTCGQEEVDNPEGAVASNFANLANGRAAIEARLSDSFTDYDGWVPGAGAECDPYRKDAAALSASRLEALAKNPMDYFFEHVLGIKEPQEYGADPAVWLDALERGSLLHEVFEEFMKEIKKKNRPPDSGEDMGLLEKILKNSIDRKRGKIPAPSDDVLARETEDLQKIAKVFLEEESRYCKTNVPMYFEANIGIPSFGEGSPIDTPEPLEIALPGGKTVRTHGRIDRIDQVAGKKDRFAVWDYKTGSAWGFDKSSPNMQGRNIQNTLYVELLKARFKQMGLKATIESFGYFFPSLKEWGKRVSWSAAELTQGKQTIALLCDMLGAGCFPVSDNKDDLKFSGYRSAYGDVDSACEESKRKLSNPGNKELRPFMALRGYTEAGDDE